MFPIRVTGFTTTIGRFTLKIYTSIANKEEMTPGDNKFLSLRFGRSLLS